MGYNLSHKYRGFVLEFIESAVEQCVQILIVHISHKLGPDPTFQHMQLLKKQPCPQVVSSSVAKREEPSQPEQNRRTNLIFPRTDLRAPVYDTARSSESFAELHRRAGRNEEVLKRHPLGQPKGLTLTSVKLNR
jgi:hypothetical protein